MRPIDADALRESLFESSQFDTYNDYSMVIDTIDLVPTIEERKKGKWIDARDFCGEFLCSNCHETNINNFYKYCPHCGAEIEIK